MFCIKRKLDFSLKMLVVVDQDFEAAVTKMEDILAGHDERGEMTSTELKMAQDAVIQDEHDTHNDAKAYKDEQGRDDYDPEDRSVGEHRAGHGCASASPG